MPQPMRPSGNPAVPPISADRYGQPIGRPYRSYLGGAPITTAMSAPDSRAKCAFLDQARRGQFLVYVPDGTSDFTIHYGRWVDAPQTHGTTAGPARSGWLEMGTVVVTGAAEGEFYETPAFETYSDAVGCYLTDFDAPANATFQIWSRGVPA